MTPTRHSLVLTGGPASGKTGLFNRLKTLPQLGTFVFLDELARQLEPLYADRDVRAKLREETSG